MLPIYKAINFSNIMIGGSTKPWQILVNVDGSPVAYVVKLYKKEYIDESFTVAKEIYSSIIATELKIKTPPAALIEFPNEFISSLPGQLQNDLDSSDSRLKFGTQLIQGAFPFLDTLALNKYNDIDSIYAFDNLIKNGDRRTEKPNVLFKGSDVFVIDHEITFAINNETIKMFNDNRWVYNKEAHIFFRYLRDKSIGEKRLLFRDFQQNLTQINFNMLDSYYQQLNKLRHDTDINYYQIKAYLCELQRNAGKFVQLLLAHLG